MAKPNRSFIKSKDSNMGERFLTVISVPVDPAWQIDLTTLEVALRTFMFHAVEARSAGNVRIAFSRSQNIYDDDTVPVGDIIRILEHKESEKLRYNGVKVVSDGTYDIDDDCDEDDDYDEDEE